MANASQSATQEEAKQTQMARASSQCVHYWVEIRTIVVTKLYRVSIVNNGIKARTVLFTEQCFDCDNEMRQNTAVVKLLHTIYAYSLWTHV